MFHHELYLQSKLSIRPVMARHIVALCPKIKTTSYDTMSVNIHTLESILPKDKITPFVCSKPYIITCEELPSWIEFLTSYGLSCTQIKDFVEFKSSVIYNTSLYDYGIDLLVLKDKGLTNDLILKKIIGK